MIVCLLVKNSFSIFTFPSSIKGCVAATELVLVGWCKLCLHYHFYRGINMKKRLIHFILISCLCLLLLSTSAFATIYTKEEIDYDSISIASYDSFRRSVIGNGYNVDGWYGCQCWDGAVLLWKKLGMFLHTAYSYYNDEYYSAGVRTCWEYEEVRTANAGEVFSLVLNKEDIQRGDIIVFGGTGTGHIGFADENYWDGMTSIALLAQNQTEANFDTGHPFDVQYNNLGNFLGAFRLKKWSGSGIPLPNGTYYLKSALNTDYAVSTNGTNVELANFDPSSKKQQFFIQSNNGYYEIINVESGMTLDVSGASPNAGANLQQIAISTGGINDAQRWYFESDGDGYYYIHSKLGTYIDVNGTAAGGQNVRMNGKTGANAQKFQLRLMAPTLTIGKTAFNVGDEITAYWTQPYGSGSYKYYLAEYPEAFAYSTNVRNDNTLEHYAVFSNLPMGHYSMFVQAASPYAESDQSNWISFDVYAQDYKPIIRSNFDGHIYAVYDYEASWSFCKSLCEDMGGHLVTINSAEECAFVNNLVKTGAKDAYWVGATNYNSRATNQDGAWQWITDEAFSYTNWKSGEPSASGTGGTRQHWAELRKSISYQWNNSTNTNKANKGFIIEIEPDYNSEITARAMYNGHEYLVIDKDTTWSEAQGYCLSLGGQLAALNDADEEAFVDTLIEQGSRSWYYVGGVRRSDGWHWLNGTADGEKISSINWNGDLWGAHCNYLMKYKASKKYINFPNTYYPEKDISHIGFICEINNPLIPVNSISLDQPQCSLTVDDTVTLIATVLPEEAADKTVTWTSSNTAVATVDADGKVTAVAPGTATITATAGGKPAECIVTVSPKPVYRIGELTVRNASGAALPAIPSGQFLVTIPITKQTDAGNSLIFLASYNAAGQYKGLMFVAVKDVPVGATVEVTLPVDNSRGDIAQLKAFPVASFSNLVPLGIASCFPKQ